MPKRILICIAVFGLSADSFATTTWQRNLEKNGIIIETRSVTGSSYKEFKATMTAKTSMQKVLTVMDDIPGYAHWMKDCKEAKRIRVLGPNSGIVYSLQSAPWPIADREAVVQYSYKKSAKPPAISVSLAAVPDAIPATPGKVRIAQLKGYWQFSEVDKEHVEVIYSLHSEPGGNLPAWAAAGMVAHLPYETLAKLRQRLEN